MADHPKYYLGGTKRHSSKDSKTTTHDIEIKGSHSTEQKTSLSRSNRKHRDNRTAEIDFHNKVSVENKDNSNKDILKHSRRTRRSISSSRRKPEKEPDLQALEAVVDSFQPEKIETVGIVEAKSDTRGRRRKRSLPTPRPEVETSLSHKRLKRSSESFPSFDVDGDYNSLTRNLSGIRASLRSNPQVKLLKGLSPVRRRSLSSNSSNLLLVTSQEVSRPKKQRTSSKVPLDKTSKSKKILSKKSSTKTEVQSSYVADSHLPKKRSRLDKLLRRGSGEVEHQSSSTAEDCADRAKPSKRRKQKSLLETERESGVSLRSKLAARTTGSCASNRRRASVVVGSKESAPAASTSTNSLTIGPSSSVFKPSTMSSGQGSSDAPPSSQAVPPAEGQEASAEGGASASAAPALGSFASLIQTLDQDSNDVGRLQALLEARGLPSHLFGALGPRMHQILHRSMIGGSVSKAQQLLQGLQSKDENQQLTAVIEMCQLLVMGNEDTLAGFPMKQVVPALISLLQMEHNFDMMHHACRALTYMMEALPRSSAVVVDAVPVFLEKLQAIQCMDVAEQSLQALEMLSKKHNKAILHANGVLACLTFVDFFSISAQRSALSITANCCQSMTMDEFHYVRESLPLLTARLNQHDKKSLESVCLCMARLVDNYQSDEKILKEIAADGFLANIQQLLVMTPPIINTGMFVTVIRMLVLMCSNCPDLAVQLLRQNIAETLCHLLVGLSNQGATQNIELVTRTPQELYEIVCLIGQMLFCWLCRELMPKLPQDGLFSVDQMLRKSPIQNTDAVIWQWLDDHGMWHPYSLIDSRIIEAAHQSGEHEVSLTIFGGNYTIDFDTSQQINDDTGTARHVQRKTNSLLSSATSVPKSMRVKSDSREDILHKDASLATTFIKTLFCVLYEVYSSSAGPSVRHKCLQVIMRMMYHGSPELLKCVLPSCNVSSHIAAMMASNDLKIVVAGVQMANILMEKLPDVFNVYFCREGVMHQIKKLCESEVMDLSTKKEAPPPSEPCSVVSTPAEATGTATPSASLVVPGSSKDNPLNTVAAVPMSQKRLEIPTPVATPDVEKTSSLSPRLLSSVLKHKKLPKRGGRKGNKGEPSPDLHAVLGEPSGSTPVDLVPVARGKWSSSSKASFLAGLHPSRWGRSNSSGPDRPSPPLPPQVGLSHILYQEAVRPPALPPRPHVIDNRDKIKQWISEQAMKFCGKYYGAETRGIGHPALNSLNQLCNATAMLLNVDQEIEGLHEIATIIRDSNMSPFEIIHSGLVSALLNYLTGVDTNARDTRIKRFLLVFLGCRAKDEMFASDLDIYNSQAFAALVSKLMSCFHYLEQFQVKVHDLPRTSGSTGRGSNALRFFDTHQLKCNLQRHSSCTTLRQWRGGPVKIDPLALVQAIERYLIMRGYGRLRPNADNECSDDDASDDDIDDTMAAVSISQGAGRHRIEFLINDHVLPYNMTVYEAVKQFSGGLDRENSEMDTDSENPYGSTGIWINTHTIWFRPAADQEGNPGLVSSPKKTKSDKCRNRHISKSTKVSDIDSRASILEEFLTTNLPASVTVKDPSLQVLALLRMLNAFNRHWGILFEKSNAEMLLSPQEFLSSKLTAKANRQLQDLLIIMTGNMPQWLIQIGRACPFLLPFDTRLALFYATTFDRDRAMHRLQDTSHEAGPADSTERVAPRLERKKSLISRDEILKQGEKVINDLGNSKAILEIQYENEVGTGLGPTLEFYALISRELQRADLDLWHGDPVRLQELNGNEEGTMYVYSPCGLFPAPLPKSAKSAHVNKVKSQFRFLGKFMAKALMDSRMLDISLSQSFYKWMLNQELSLGPDDLIHVHPVIAKSFSQLYEILRQKKRIEADRSHTPESRRLALESLMMDGCTIEDLSVDFVLPGYPNIELKKGGKDIPLTLDNLDEYLKLVAHWTLVEGTTRQFESIREGFETMFPLSALTLFYPEEMEQLFCGNMYEPWTVRYLTEACRPDHGYTQESKAIKFLFEILASFSATEQRLFLQFTTGSPKLPVGGLKSLNPPLTIVRKAAEANENPDDFLPSVMTCVNYLKLPEYSNKEVMRAKLMLAVREGQLSFHLS